MLGTINERASTMNIVIMYLCEAVFYPCVRAATGTENSAGGCLHKGVNCVDIILLCGDRRCL